MDATDKQHNHITELQKHPREQHRNEPGTRWGLAAARGVLTALPVSLWASQGQPQLHTQKSLQILHAKCQYKAKGLVWGQILTSLSSHRFAKPI